MSHPRNLPILRCKKNPKTKHCALQDHNLIIYSMWARKSPWNCLFHISSCQLLLLSGSARGYILRAVCQNKAFLTHCGCSWHSRALRGNLIWPALWVKSKKLGEAVTVYRVETQSSQNSSRFVASRHVFRSFHEIRDTVGKKKLNAFHTITVLQPVSFCAKYFYWLQMLRLQNHNP